MVMSARQRQKQVEKRNKKRQLARKAAAPSAPASGKAEHYVGSPFRECLVPGGLFDSGIGSVIVSREARGGMLAVSAFVVDVFCLGVKNAFFRLMTESRYEDELMPSMIESHDGQPFDRVHQACVKKLIVGAVDYAEDLGFHAHHDYRGAIALLNDVDAGACPQRIEYGNDGKPFYIRGPKETIRQAEKIVERLSQRCGEGNFHYLVMTDPVTTDDR
jgi:hypothetical protein